MQFIRLILLAVLFFPAPIFLSSATGNEAQALWTVQNAVRFALDNSPDARVAVQRIKAAHATIDQAKSAFYPRLGISSGYSRTNNPMYSFGNILNQGVFNQNMDFNDPGTTDNLNLATRLQYRFYNGGRDRAALEAARAAKTATRMEQRAVHLRLAFEVVRAFCTIAQAGETVQARESAVKAIEASLLVARARYDAGDLLRTDLLNLEVQKSSASENLIQARHAFDLAGRAFLNLLGLEQGSVAIDTGSNMEQPLPDDLNFDNRPELAALSAMITAAESEVRKAKSGYYPTADAFGSYQVDKGYHHEDSSGNSWGAGVKLNYSLFDGNLTTAAVEEAQARRGEAMEMKRKMELAIHLEVEQASIALKQAEERLRVTEKMIEQTLENARLYRERFREGVALSTDLIDAENRLTDARLRHSLARSSRRIAVADLRRAVGLEQFGSQEIRGSGDQGIRGSDKINHN